MAEIAEEFCRGRPARRRTGVLLRSRDAARACAGMTRGTRQCCWAPSPCGTLLLARDGRRPRRSGPAQPGPEQGRGGLCWPSERATGHPELARCLDEWLATRGLPPSISWSSPNPLPAGGPQGIRGRAAGQSRGVPGGVSHPGAERLADRADRAGPKAPNGTADLLVDAAMRAASTDDGSGYLTLGMVPLSRRAGTPPFDNRSGAAPCSAGPGPRGGSTISTAWTHSRQVPSASVGSGVSPLPGRLSLLPACSTPCSRHSTRAARSPSRWCAAGRTRPPWSCAELRRRRDPDQHDGALVGSHHAVRHVGGRPDQRAGPGITRFFPTIMLAFPERIR